MAALSPFVPEHDRQLMKAAGYGARTAKPRPLFALIVVDVSYAFCGRYRLPVQEAVKLWRNACGLEAWDAVERIKLLLAAARANGVPVFYTKGLRQETSGVAEGVQKNNRAGSDDVNDNVIVDEVAPSTHDQVFAKSGPSAFFGTSLVTSLVSAGVRTIVVVGGVTSGCVRATVVDGYSYGYTVLVPKDACFDRLQSSHHMSLFEMDAKYADVIDTRTVVDMLGARDNSGEV